MTGGFKAKLVSTVLCVLAVPAPLTNAQTLDAEPRFGSLSLASGFSPDPMLSELAPGGTDSPGALPSECVGYINASQPDFRLSFQANSNPLGILVNSSADTTLLVSDPAGNWYCNDDTPYLADTNPGVQITTPLSGDYHIWVGTYEQDAAPLYTILGITEQPTEQWAALDFGVEDMVLAMSLDENGGIVFGADSDVYTNDGECDDPRFEGAGAVFGSSPSELFADASDCRAEFEAGRVTLKAPGTLFADADSSMGIFEDDVDLTGVFGPGGAPMPESAGSQLLASVLGALGNASEPGSLDGSNDLSRYAYTEPEDIDFGDNSSMWADDGECDDPRFAGEGMASFTVEDDRLRDANDCENLYLEGGLTFLEGEIIDPNAAVTAFIANSEIDFGNNNSVWSDDGECDDPRFSGPGVAAFTDPSDAGQDANDCARLFMEGGLSFNENFTEQPTLDLAELSDSLGIDFGDNSSVFANDGECDDPRFSGPGMAASTEADNEMRDANDCADLFLQGELDYGEADDSSSAGSAVVDGGRIDFGDNEGIFADDGECDDPRFEGQGPMAILSESNRGHDAADCRAAYQAGTITFVGGELEPDSDSGGSPISVESVTESQQIASLAIQSQQLVSGPRGAIDGANRPDGSIYASGTVYGDPLAPGGRNVMRSAPPIPDLPTPERSTPSSLVNFGDNSSVWADDGECDDPRFEGTGMADYVFDEDIMKDANDCKAAYDMGTITLKN